MCHAIYIIWGGKKSPADDAEVSKTPQNTCIKYDTLGFKGLKQLTDKCWKHLALKNGSLDNG